MPTAPSKPGEPGTILNRRGGEGTTAPTEIPADDVRSALASTDDRIPAIKALRELHPGLGLKDAMDLIDAQRGEQGPHH
ncbi:ribosomal protein L7/L12 [Rhodococcus sp. H-CA8f]|uniref:ribosomal protein L7/L12 n=1 Tax=Rhodococcus sp. H-CA8f TaxID=1727214 RepID=UPI001E2B7D30|nr:ribosomal protein L7/L12 [Rhodococcus sp. H-CA8f]